jgi:hypothetical protein
MFTFEDTENQIHVWSVNKGFYLSYESEKRLLSFDNIDDVINHLYINGFRQTAKDIHAKNKNIKLEAALKAEAEKQGADKKWLDDHLEVIVL